METSLGWVQQGKKACWKAWKKIQLSLGLEVEKVLKSSIILRIKAVPGCSLEEAARERKGLQKVSLSCLTSSSEYSSTYAQSLQPWSAPHAFWAGFCPLVKIWPQAMRIYFASDISPWAVSTGWTEQVCLTSHLALQLTPPTSRRRKRQQEICRNSQQHGKS